MKHPLSKLDKRVLSTLHPTSQGGLLASEIKSECDNASVKHISASLYKLKRRGLVVRYLGCRGNRKEVWLFEKAHKQDPSYATSGSG